MVTDGDVESSTKVNASCVILPNVSVAFTVKLWAPSAAPLNASAGKFAGVALILHVPPLTSAYRIVPFESSMTSMAGTSAVPPFASWSKFFSPFTSDALPERVNATLWRDP